MTNHKAYRIFSVYLAYFLQLSYTAFFFDEDPNILSEARLGKFLIRWDSADPYLQIVHADNTSVVVFQTLPNWPFLSVGYATDRRLPLAEGNSKFIHGGHEWTLYETPNQNIKKVTMSSDDEILISGEVWGAVTVGMYHLKFFIPTDESGRRLTSQLGFHVDVATKQGTFNRVYLNYWCHPTENFYGFGTQVTQSSVYSSFL